MSFKQKLIKGVAASLLTIIAFSSQADMYNISFDEAGVHGPTLGNNTGTIIDDEYGANGAANLGGINVNFWAQKRWNVNKSEFKQPNANNKLYLTLFNSSADFQTEDDDLIVGKKNIGVIHERNGECSNGVTCTDPDDRFIDNDRSPNGGFIFVEFSSPVSVHSIDLVDIEGGKNQGGRIGFFDSATDLIGNWTNMIVTGDSSWGTQTFANSGDTVSYMVLKMKGSGGFKNLAFSTPSDIPEPSSIALLGLALAFAVRKQKA